MGENYSSLGGKPSLFLSVIDLNLMAVGSVLDILSGIS
jgi:hypothetical protein